MIIHQKDIGLVQREDFSFRAFSKFAGIHDRNYFFRVLCQELDDSDFAETKVCEAFCLAGDFSFPFAVNDLTAGKIIKRNNGFRETGAAPHAFDQSFLFHSF